MDTADEDRLLSIFPGLAECQWAITSPETIFYNCIAWAVFKDEDANWWPHLPYWPKACSATPTVADFAEVFALVGFAKCDSQELEPGYEKVALYALNGNPTHAARQLPNGHWTSKLGELQDITHETPEAIEGDGEDAYGQVEAIFKRKLT